MTSGSMMSGIPLTSPTVTRSKTMCSLRWKNILTLFFFCFNRCVLVFKPPVSQHPVESVEGGRRAQKVVAALVVQL